MEKAGFLWKLEKDQTGDKFVYIGWVFDTVRGKISLSDEKRRKYVRLLSETRLMDCIELKHIEKLSGIINFCSMVYGCRTETFQIIHALKHAYANGSVFISDDLRCEIVFWLNRLADRNFERDFDNLVSPHSASVSSWSDATLRAYGLQYPHVSQSGVVSIRYASGSVPPEYRENIQMAEMYAIYHLSDLIGPIGDNALDINTDNLNVMHNLQKGRSNRSKSENDLIRQIAKNFETKRIFWHVNYVHTSINFADAHSRDKILRLTKKGWNRLSDLLAGLTCNFGNWSSPCLSLFDDHRTVHSFIPYLGVSKKSIFFPKLCHIGSPFLKHLFLFRGPTKKTFSLKES